MKVPATTPLRALSSILVTTALLPSLALGACYTFGQLVDFQESVFHSQRACRGYDDVAGAFQGWFAPGQTKYTCVNSAWPDKKIEMSVKNENLNQGFDLADGDCAWEFYALIEHCPQYGGEGTTAGWTFRLDPNPGRC